MHTICACAIISHVQVQQISLFRVSCSAGNTQKLSWWRVDIFIVNNYFKFFIWHKKDKIRNCFSFLPNCWMSFLFSAKEFAFIRVMLKFSSFSPVTFCSMGERLSPTPPIHSVVGVSTTAAVLSSSSGVLAVAFIFQMFSGCLQVNGTALKSWYMSSWKVVETVPLYFTSKTFLIIVNSLNCEFEVLKLLEVSSFLIGQEMTKLPVTASRTGKPFFFCILLSPGRALVIEALHDVYDYHQWALPLHQVEKGSSVFASAVAGGKFSFIPSFFNLNWNLQKVLPDVGRSTS